MYILKYHYFQRKADMEPDYGEMIVKKVYADTLKGVMEQYRADGEDLER